MVACEPIICSLLTVLTQHWYSSRCSGNVTSNQRELESSQLLVEALALVRQSNRHVYWTDVYLLSFAGRMAASSTELLCRAIPVHLPS